MNKTKLANAISIAIAGAVLTAGASSAIASTTMYNSYNAGQLPGQVAGLPNLATDGWTHTNGPTNSGALNPWYGTPGGALPFGYTGAAALSWAIEITGPGDFGTISSKDSEKYSTAAGYVGAADIDTPKGAWLDGEATPQGWRHGTDLGVIKVNADTVIRLTPFTADGVSADNYGISVFEDMDISTSWSHHGAWHKGYVVGDTTPANLALINTAKIGTTVGSFVGFMDSSGLGPYGGNSVTFLAQAGKTYTVMLGGRDNVVTSWSSPLIGYGVKVNAFVRENTNNDLTADLLWRNSTSGDHYLFNMNGATVTPVAVDASVTSAAWETKGRGDYNGDGKADILQRNPTTGATRVFLMNNGAVLNTATLTASIPVGNDIIGNGDYDGDGKSDFIWRDASSGAVHQVLMNGTSVLSDSVLETRTAAWDVKGTGDYNGDGKADLLWRDTSGSTEFKYTGIATATPTVPSVIPVAYDVKGSGDFNGDGKDDVIWGGGASATAKDYYWMNGKTLAIRDIVYGLPAEWVIQGTGDYNGEGRADLIWRSTVSGDIYLTPELNMGSAAALNYSVPATTPWQIVYTKTQR